MLWENLRCEEFKDAVEKCNKVCVIPIGCVEAHGVHLPLGCDTIKAREFCARASEIHPVCVFPAMYFGEKCGSGEFPGTIIFPIPLIWQILEQSCLEAARNGFEKILIVSSHGGNTNMLMSFVQHMMDKMDGFVVYHYYQRMATPDMVLGDIESFPYLTDEDKAIMQDYVDNKKMDGHGGFVETGCLYDICPEYVRLDRMDAVSSESVHRFDELNRAGIRSPFFWMGDYPNSYAADMHYGLNERIAKAIAAKTVESTARAFKCLREETVSMEYYKEWMAKQ
ncbi:MAG: creatininase family protein [Ruminococcaceae bacterium]|nr:creatininase family protein [Oscillospiraceae bacterium]